PFGGIEPVAATNPISIAAPSGGPHPVALDMATTTVAAGKIRLARKLGQ
ncbi:MAG TPA: malate dehydrogenase, partial [Planctomycetaceae bacterium]|nr:malate dehydrogenase [Planctomycetaceae bacterium]